MNRQSRPPIGIEEKRDEIFVVRTIVSEVPDDVAQNDLEKYRQRAIEIGSTDAKIIPADMVVIDERVRLKCVFPYATGMEATLTASLLTRLRVSQNCGRKV